MEFLSDRYQLKLSLKRKSTDLKVVMQSMQHVSVTELAKHDKSDDCWVAVEGKVYNVTPYLDTHPGGYQLLFKCAGTDATANFSAVHTMKQKDVVVKLAEFEVGVLVDGTGEPCPFTMMNKAMEEVAKKSQSKEHGDIGEDGLLPPMPKLNKAGSKIGRAHSLTHSTPSNSTPLCTHSVHIPLHPTPLHTTQLQSCSSMAHSTSTPTVRPTTDYIKF